MYMENFELNIEVKKEEKRAYENMRQYLRNKYNLDKNCQALSNAIDISEEMLELFEQRYLTQQSGTPEQRAEYTFRRITDLLSGQPSSPSEASVKRYYKFYALFREENVLKVEIVDDGSYTPKQSTNSNEVRVQGSQREKNIEALVNSLESLDDTQFNQFVSILSRLVGVAANLPIQSQIPSVATPVPQLGDLTKMKAERFIHRVRTMLKPTARPIFIAEDKLLLATYGISYYAELDLPLNPNLNMLELTESQLAFLSEHYHTAEVFRDDYCKSLFGASSTRTTRYINSYRDLQELKDAYYDEYEAYKSYRVCSSSEAYLSEDNSSSNVIDYSKYQAR